jgi:hypothetical protein
VRRWVVSGGSGPYRDDRASAAGPLSGRCIGHPAVEISGAFCSSAIATGGRVVRREVGRRTSDALRWLPAAEGLGKKAQVRAGFSGQGRSLSQPLDEVDLLGCDRVPVHHPVPIHGGAHDSSRSLIGWYSRLPVNISSSVDRRALPLGLGLDLVLHHHGSPPRWRSWRWCCSEGVPDALRPGGEVLARVRLEYQSWHSSATVSSLRPAVGWA